MSTPNPDPSFFRLDQQLASYKKMAQQWLDQRADLPADMAVLFLDVKGRTTAALTPLTMSGREAQAEVIRHYIAFNRGRGRCLGLLYSCSGSFLGAGSGEPRGYGMLIHAEVPGEPASLWFGRLEEAAGSKRELVWEPLPDRPSTYFAAASGDLAPARGFSAAAGAHGPN